MAIAIVMPRLGMTMKEGTVIEWRAKVGQALSKGEVVLIIESEKAEAEIEAPADGVLRHVYVEPETTVPSGTLLAAMTDSADEAFDAEAFESQYNASDDRAPARASQADGATRDGAGGGAERATSARATAAPGAGGRRLGARADARAGGPASPAARRRARELNVDLATVAGSGPGGRITREDVEQAARESTPMAGDGSTRCAPAPAEMAAGGKLVEVAAGVSLEVLERGDAGDRVLLLPGLGTDVSAFARVVPALAEHYRVAAINGRGVGASDAPAAESYDLATAAADVRAIAKGQPVHLVGASMGAAIALETAIAYPGVVRSLVLITPFATQSGRLAAVGDAWLRLASAASAEVLAAAIVPWMFSPGFLADTAQRRRARRAFAATSGQVRAETVARQVAGITDWSGTRAQALASLDVPALILGAADDLLVGDGADLAAAIPAAQHAVVGEAGHAVTVEAPEAVAKILLAYLAGVCQPPPSDL